MKVQIFLEAGLPASEVAQLARQAEDVGIETLWASSFPARRDAFLALSLAAGATSRIRLGVVPVSPYEIHPLRLSDALLTLNDMSQGRASLLVGGLGHSVARVTGLKPERRVTAVRDCVRILRGASAETALNYQGQMYSALDYHPEWATATAPRVCVGANGKQMLRMAGEEAAGVMLSDVPLARMAEVRGHLHAGLEKSGRDWPEFSVGNFFAWHVKPDREAAVREARREMIWRGLLQAWHTEPFLGAADAQFVEQHRDAFLQAFLQRTHVIEGVPERIIDALVANLCFAGDLSEMDRIIAELRQFRAAGLDEITLKIHGDAVAAIRDIGTYLVPVLA